MADISGSSKGSEVSTSLPYFLIICLLSAFYTTEIGINLQKCLMKYKRLLKYPFTYHMLSIFKDFENKYSNFYFGWVYFQICRGASAQPVEIAARQEHKHSCVTLDRSFYNKNDLMDKK